MRDILARLPAALLIWATAAALLWWGRLPGGWRRGLALLASALGIGFLVLAVTTEGVRESPTIAVFLLGTPYVTEQVSASASLPYYVLTAVCLLLGTVGLAVGDGAARALWGHWMATAVGLSFLVTALRFGLEKVAAPAALTWMVGVTWLAPVVGAFFFWNLRAEGRGWTALLWSLLVYGVTVRAGVAALYLAASTLGLGSHYDVSAVLHVYSPIGNRRYDFTPGTFDPVLRLGILPQLVVWPVFTLVAGLLGAGVAWLLPARLPVPRPAGPAAEPAVETNR